MEQKELESLIIRLLDTKSITAKEAVDLLKLNQPTKEYIYIDRPVYPYWDYTRYPYTFSTTSETTAITAAASTKL